MKPWLKWTLAGLVIALMAAGAVRTLNARKARQAALDAQQIAQRTEVSVALNASDVVTVRTRDLAQTIAIAGAVKAVNSAMIKARVPGELLDLSVREGDVVQAGQVLARIDPTESQARLRQALEQAQSAKAQVEIAQRTFDNNQALVKQGFISNTALTTSQANLAAAQAGLAAAQANVDLSRKARDDTVMRAPMAGQISQRLVQPGERVGVDARIVEIVDNSRLELEANVNAADSLQVRPGQTASLHIDGVEATLTARVVRINPSATSGSRAVPVYLALSPLPALRQGLFAQGSLSVGTLRALTVPLNAVRTDQPQPYVQLVQQGQVQRVGVQTGARSEQDGQTLVAITGVPEGALLVAGSVGPLRPGTRVNLAP